MSDTPLTDAMQDATDWELSSYPEQLKDAWEHARQMEVRMRRAEKDTERVDWILDNAVCYNNGGSYETFYERKAADKAMRND